jgi:glycosyltransferase involved in cell wall biosynthesis
MKVLILGWELPPFNSGGLGVASLFLTLHLKNFIPEITFALPAKLPLQNLPFKIIFASEIITNQNFIPSGYLILEDAPLPTFLKDLISSYGPKLYQMIKNNTPKIIHAHDWFTAPAGVYLKSKLKVPAVIHVHSTEVERTGGNPSHFIYQIEKNHFSKFDRVLAVGPITKDILIHEYKIPEEKVKVVPNGMIWEENEFHRMPKYFERLKDYGFKFVLFVGRIVLQKGPDYLLRAAPLVLQKCPKTKFCFVGSGDMQNYLIHLAHELKVADDLFFVGFLREGELAGMYHIGDVLVVPSVFDPFGLVPLEGILHGLPVITSKTTGVSHFLHHIMTFDFWDIKEMANKIVGLLNYPVLKSEYYKNLSLEAKEKFCWRKSAEAVFNIYKELCPQL